MKKLTLGDMENPNTNTKDIKHKGGTYWLKSKYGKYEPITFEERTKIEVLVSQGVNTYKIAQALERSYAGIKKEIWRGGGKKYIAQDAQTQVEYRINNKSSGIKATNVLRAKGPELLERISSLEMQLEIVIDEIKQLRKHVKQNN